MNKHAQLPLEETIFIVLNIIFFGALLYFVVAASSGALVYENVYAKQTALLIDQAKPGTVITLNVKDAYDISKKNEISLNNIFWVEGNNVYVKLSSRKAFRYPFFSDVKVEKSFSITAETVYLILEVKENE
jgi:hypothetical protein